MGKLKDFLFTENFILVHGKPHIRGAYSVMLPIEMDSVIEDSTALKMEG
ncbi:hypothetical protein M2326_001806 [Flavobacterium sp. 7A]|nr:hypothetical protein [Flavobacterium sp. 7A]